MHAYSATAARAAARPRTLACTADDMWLWPAMPLTERRGGAIVPVPPPVLYRRIAALHGPSVHLPPLERAIEHAAALVNVGRWREADEAVAALSLSLPPVTFDGAALMKAVGRRLRIGVPQVTVAGWPSTTPPDLFERIAAAYDAERDAAQKLQGVFDPTLHRAAPATVPFDPMQHPRWPAGQTDGGRFRPRDGSSGDLALPVADTLEEQQLEADAARRERWARFFFELGQWLGHPPNSCTELRAAPPAPPDEDEPPDTGEHEDDDGAGEGDGLPELGSSGWPFEIPHEKPAGIGAGAEWGRRIAMAIKEALDRNDCETAGKILHAAQQVDWLTGDTEYHFLS
jgi:hypothetical protein